MNVEEQDVLPKEKVEALKQGDETAWREFFATYDPLINYVVSWSKWHFNEPTRRDVAQGVRAEILKSKFLDSPAAHIKICVRRLAISRCIDEVRKLARRNELMVSVGEDMDTYRTPSDQAEKADFDPIRSIIAQEEGIAIREAVGSLGDPCAAMIGDFYLKQISYKDMATKHEISIKTVGSRLSRCMQKLKEQILKNPIFTEDVARIARKQK